MNEDQQARIEEAQTIGVGGPVTDTKVTVCLYAKDIDLDAVSAALGTEPSEGVVRGQVVGRRRPAPFGHWFLDPPENLAFEEKIAYLLR